MASSEWEEVKVLRDCYHVPGGLCLQGKKMATSLAGQAQEQMRKALAAREKAGKTDKRA